MGGGGGGGGKKRVHKLPVSQANLYVEYIE